MNLGQLYLLLTDDCPSTWDKEALRAEIDELEWTPIGIVNDTHGEPCDLKGQFQVEPGGLIRPAPGLKATMWPDDKIWGIPTVRLRILAPWRGDYRLPHPTTFEKVFMVDQIVLGTFGPPPLDRAIGRKDRRMNNCALSNLYWDPRKRAKWD